MNKLFLILSITVPILVATGCAPEGPTAVRENLSRVGASGEGPTDRAIRREQARISRNPKDVKAYNLLGRAFVQKGRDTGDPAWYWRGRQAIEKALELAPDDPITLRNIAFTVTIFHDFDRAIQYANRSLKLDPDDPDAYGVLTDSAIELGRYEEAREACQKMLDLKPDLASYSRGARLRFIYGDVKGAVILMTKALECGAPYTENSAWCHVQLGDFALKSGALAAADQHYRAALAQMRDYRHAHAGLGRLAFAKGDVDSAIKEMELANKGVAALPYVIELGDLYKRAGRAKDAEAQYAKVSETVKTFRSYGIEGEEVLVATHLLDQNKELGRALDLARTEIDHHHSVEAFAAAAAAFMKTGNLPEARRCADQALRTKIQDPVIWFRLAAVYRAAGDLPRAEQLTKWWNGITQHVHPLYDAQSVAMR